MSSVMELIHSVIPLFSPGKSREIGQERTVGFQAGRIRCRFESETPIGIWIGGIWIGVMEHHLPSVGR